MSARQGGYERGVDRNYATAEQYERWFIRDCTRCGKPKHVAGRWPDGPVCRTCHDRALAENGSCPGCGQQCALPGRDAAGAAICTRCAGFTQSYACTRCRAEGKLHRGKLCSRCTLTDQLDELLDDGTGQVAPRLEPLRDVLVAMQNPLAGLAWLTTRPHVARFLRGLARAETELTHEAFHQLEPWRAAAHLRELLMSCGLLPEIDKHILSFERWLVATHLPILGHDAHRLIREFATWHVLPTLRRRAVTRPLTPNTRRMAGSETKRATAFLAWLDAQGRDLRRCAQADLDRWHAEHRGHEHQELRPFLQWAMRTGRTPRLDVPRHEAPRRAPITQHHRLGLLRRLLTDDTAPLRARVAAVLTLLYAQPLSRIVRLTTDDVLTDADQVQLHLGDPPVPVPEPFAALLVEHIAKRTNMGTATNPNSTWLFPGRRAGQPLRPEVLGEDIRNMGLPTVLGRTAALRQLVLQAPAPVVADMLGFHTKHTARVYAQAGGTWNRYAPGPHT